MGKWQPYAYQEEVSRLLLAGHSVVLQAPTGAGKTTAALLPFLHAWREESNEYFPTKCLYVVPMRVLAHQFVHEYRERAVSIKRRYRRSLDVRIQTGDQQDDRRFEGDLIFCTVDQFLSSYLTMPYSQPGRLANINAGAIVGTYIVFDEFHLLDPGSTLPSVLYALKQLNQLAPVLIMTATFSTKMLHTLANQLRGQVVLVTREESRQIETRQGKVAPRQRIWYTVNEALTAEAVLNAHRRRSLALCNTVRQAQTIARQLRSLIAERELGVEVLLLHSRFLPKDRRQTEERLRLLFGKEADQAGSAIAVATQTIEVGVDITCETLHTELAPASALIQRAGRCARYPGEKGKVIVYPVDRSLPYQTEHAAEMPIAYAWLQEHTTAKSESDFDFAREQLLVDAVATPRDEKILLSLSAGQAMRADAIHRVLNGERQGDDQRLLVRDADSRLVLIHPEPNKLLEQPHSAVGFNLPTTTLYGLVKAWLERDEDVEWRVKRLIEDYDPEENNRASYDWREMVDSSQLRQTRVLVVSPGLAGYTSTEGFNPDQGGSDFVSSLPLANVTEQSWQGTGYKLESYENHIRRVITAFAEVALPEIAFPAEELAKVAGWPAGSVLQAAWFVCLLHDIGKLSQKWQGWARAYQAQIGERLPPDFAAAHTHWDWYNQTHREAEAAIRGKHPKPHHAGEGALAVSGILTQALGRQQELLVRAAIAAITRHHTPFAQECQIYALEPQARTHIEATLAYIPAELQPLVDLNLLRSQITTPPHTFASLLIKPHEIHGWMAYTLLVRALRRADQEGTARGISEEK